MSLRPKLYMWKQVPFLRLLLPLIAGILLQFTRPFSVAVLIGAASIIALSVLIFSLLSLAAKYSFRWMPGVAINIALIVAGASLIYKQDISNKKNWIGNLNTDSAAVLVTLQEPLIEKAKTYKAEASIDAVNLHGEWKMVAGRVLIYFSKDNISTLRYGSQVLFYKKPLQLIKNSGNPGSFDYKQYNAFQNIFHQVFLKSNEYQVTKSTNENACKAWF